MVTVLRSLGEWVIGICVSEAFPEKEPIGGMYIHACGERPERKILRNWLVGSRGLGRPGQQAAGAGRRMLLSKFHGSRKGDEAGPARLRLEAEFPLPQEPPGPAQAFC